MTKELNQKEKDFTKEINEKSTGVAKAIMENILNNFHLFDGSNGDSEEELKKLDLERMNYAIDLTALISQTDLPMDYSSYPMEKIIAGLNVVKFYLEQVQKSWEKEILSRVVGVKSPMDEKYDKEFATIKEVMNTLIKLRKETGADEYLKTPVADKV